MTLREYAQLFRRGRLVIILLTLLGVGAGVLLSLVATPTYTSTSSILVSVRGDETPAGLQQASTSSASRAPTYASLATSALVIDAASALARTSPAELQASVTATAREGQGYIDVSAQASTAEEAQARAQAVADVLSTQAPASDTLSANSPLVLEVVTPADLPEVATFPRPRNNVFFGAVIGLVLGIGIVVVVQSLDDRIRSASDLPRGAQLATVTSLPAPRARSGRSGAVGEVRLEAFRHLRANLQFGTRTGGVIAVAGVTSSSRADEVASQLAAVLGEIKLAVVVVDVDLRTGAGRRAADGEVPAFTAGVADVLAGRAAVDEVLQSGGADGVWSVPAGSVQPSSAQQVSTPAMRDMLAALEARFDYVLLACPPVIERSEASVIAALSRSSLLIVESGATTRAGLLYALELLEGVGATSVSVALDHVRGPDLGRSSSSTTEGPAPVPQVGVR